MGIIDTLARDVLGISGSQLVVIGVLAFALVAAWALIKAVLRIALRVFALGCVTILGVVLGLYILFVLIR
jgi:hypothetical protein